MKKKLLMGVAVLGLLGAVGASAGLSAGTEARLVDATGETVFYQGTNTSRNKITTWTWSEGDETLVEGTKETWSFDDNEKFQLLNTANNWGTKISVTLAGSAVTSGAFTGGAGEDVLCHCAGNYDVLLSGTTLYLDYVSGTNFYYAGSAHKTGDDWDTWTADPIEVNGGATTFTFAVDEQFKLKLLSDWDAALGFERLDSDYYGCFANQDGNIKVKYAGSYDVSVSVVDHALSFEIVAHDPSSETIYVLDKYGDLLNNAHRAHYFNGTIGTNFPGVVMDEVAGANDIYGVTYWDVMTTVVINQRGDGEKTGQTMNLTLTGNEGKCLILNHDVDGEYHWNSNTWVSLEVAKFVDKYMHFADFSESDTTPGTACKGESGYYKLAKDAYEAVSFASYREELCSLDYVVARLSAWASANNGSFVVTAGVGAFSAAQSFAPLTTASDTNVWAVALVAGAAALGIGGLFLLRRKNEN